MKNRVIAINLPQFYPFKENDEWWGKGFTEWTNVTKAKPRYRGHYQPQLPTDTGFYDLRLPEARQMQADMAKEYGIYGFCYYHYWFNGDLLMSRPLDEILSSGKPDFPFMYCWANENWSRVWDGSNEKVLMQQNYSEDDDIKHIKYLCENVFVDKRYIRIEGKPFFVIYKPHLFPNIERSIQIWREIAGEYKIDLYLAFNRQLGYSDSDCEAFLSKGFDVSINFQPICDENNDFLKSQKYLYYVKRVLAALFNHRRYTKIYDYKAWVDYRISRTKPQYKEYPCVSPGFDNSPRRVGKNFFAFKNANPEDYRRWLKYYMDTFEPFSEEENFIFVNAWNEWAEGNHLEPDIKWSRKFLEATKRVIDENE